MTRRFTRILAAFALLVSLAIPMGMWGQTTYEQLTSIANIDESAQYVLGIDGTGFHYEGTSSWGKTALPSAQTPIYYTLTKATDGNSFTAHATISGTTYYLQIPTSNTFSMATSTGTNTDIIIGTTQVSGTNYAVANKTTTARHLRINGTSGLRSYAGTTGTMAFFYKVVTSSSNTYTVTFDAGDGTFVGNTDFPNTSNTKTAGSYTLPSATPAEGYIFNGWTLGENTYESGASYTVSGNADFIASYTENTTPTGGETATLNIEAYADENNWVSGTKYGTATISPVTFTANGGGNTGKYYTSGEEWRFYQTENASITISVAEGYTLVSVTPTYSVTNSGVLKNGNTTISSGTTVSVSGTSVTFTVGNSGSATNGQVKFTNIDVVYVSDGSTQTTSDLTITNQSTDLTFDLYNNTTVQVISYTTSSTGAITITPAESDYFSYVHDAAAKTITVTPTAVTPSAQTVTINQAADDDYYAGTATFTVSVANSDPNLPGTQNNPYTVAQAIAATPSNGDVYIQGIVSSFYNTSIVGDGSNYRYYISDDGTTTTQLLVYKGKGLNQATFTSADDLLVGDEVVIYGTLITYQSAPEVASGNYLYSWNRPSITEPSVIVTPSTISAPFAGAEGTLALAYENIEEFISFDYYFCDANGNELEDTDPDYPGDWIYAEINDENEAYTLSYIIDANDGAARTAYMKVYTLDDNLEEVYAIVTVNQAKYVVDYATLPFAYDGNALAANLVPGLTQNGITDSYNNTPKIKFDDQGDYVILKINERPGILTFDIKGNGFSGGTFKVQTSEDGTTYTDLATYTELSGTAQTEEFNNLGENVRYIKWIYTYKTSGNVALGNIALAKYVAPQEFTLAVTSVSDAEIIVFDATNSDETNWVNLFEGVGNAQVVGGTPIALSVSADEGYALESLMVNGVNHVADISGGVYTFTMPSENVTISATAVEVVTAKYVKVTSTADLTSGQYLIVYEDGGVAFNGGLETLDAVGNTIDVTIQDGEINAPTAAEFTIDVTAGTIKSASGYYIGRTTNSNGMNSSTTETYTNTISIDEGNNAVITSSANPTLRYNDASNQTRFRYYGSGQKAIQLYKKVVTMEIAPNKWYLISSPVGDVAPTAVGNMTPANGYALYRFDQQGDADGKEWINYKGTNGNFNLGFGKGYLYANQNAGTLTFTGATIPYMDNSSNVLPLEYDEGADFAGYNLLGNPFNQTVWTDWDIYVMDENNNNIIPSTSRSIAPMQGFFVIAPDEDCTVTLYDNEPEGGDKGASVALNVSRNRGNVIDRAIVRMGESRQLPKFQLFENSTKVYIPQNGKDYAVVRSEGQGELPVNFRASENGTYTLSMDVENMDMNYLHLVDNMTGMDVDLLQTPSYTFEAKVNDYESRFRLVFAANNNNEDGVSTGSTTFAFYSNGSWIINNAGEATLQVVDLTGRILSSETVNGSVSKTINATPGVYMLRLINGENVKVQKIVVR